MRSKDRWNYLKRSPILAWDILFRGCYDFKYDLMPVHTLQMPLAKRINVIKTGANLIRRRPHTWAWPVHMHVELANFCNLRCIVCPTGISKLERRPTAIDPALFERLMDEVLETCNGKMTKAEALREFNGFAINRCGPSV